MLFGGIAKWMGVDGKYTHKVVSFLAMTLIICALPSANSNFFGACPNPSLTNTLPRRVATKNL